MKPIFSNKIRPFKTRLTWTLFCFGMIPALLLTVGAYVFEHSTESFVVRDSIRDEIGELISDPVRVQQHPERGMIEVFWRGYPNTPAPHRLTPRVKKLKPGYHDDIPWGGHKNYILIKDSPKGRAYVAFNVSHMESKEFWFSILLIVTITAIMYLAAWFARRSANQLSHPLEELDTKLAGIDPYIPGQRIRLVPEMPELDIVINALNGLFTRVESLIEREQRFSQTASHELRTPLTVISGAVEIIRERYGHEDHAIQRIQRAIEQMRETIESLLALARESGELPGRCRVDKLLPELVAEHDKVIANRPVRIQLERTEACLVDAPERLVSIMVLNLLRNALQHTARGEVRIRLENARLYITDTGKGIPSRIISTLLRPGTRNSAHDGGSGLGLYIVDQICRRYGWQFDMQSQEGRGTTVMVAFTPGHAAGGGA